jgi:hypothetical protein
MKTKKVNNFKPASERQAVQNKSPFRFQKYVFEYTVRDQHNNLIRGYMYENSGKASEAIKELRILFPVVAGYSERTVSLVS